MKTKEMKAKVNNSNTLPVVEVSDNTTTKGKVSSKFNLNNLADAEAEAEKLDKNKVFTEFEDFLSPISFNAEESPIYLALKPLLDSKTISEEMFNSQIDKAKADWKKANAEEIAKGENLSFAEIVEKLNTNKTLLDKVLKVSGVSELVESNYISGDSVIIYRTSEDNSGKDRYKDISISRTEKGNYFNVPLFAEYKEINTHNIVIAIRYYSNKISAYRTLNNKVKEFLSFGDNFKAMCKKGLEKGFTKSDLLAELEEACAEFEKAKAETLPETK